MDDSKLTAYAKLALLILMLFINWTIGVAIVSIRVAILDGSCKLK